jgi:hypothetical protein
MARRAAVQFVILAVAALGLAACPPVTTKTPIGTTVKATTDPGLAGVWRGRIGKSKAFSYFSFLPQKDGTTTGVLVTAPSAEDEGGWGAFTLQTVALGPNHFINARETIDEGKPATGSMADNIVPVLYHMAGYDMLTLSVIDEDAAKNAIKAGKIAGTIEAGQFGDVVLTAPPGDLDKFMAGAAGRALFPKPLVILHRLK